jgi:hypothetical protein
MVMVAAFGLFLLKFNLVFGCGVDSLGWGARWLLDEFLLDEILQKSCIELTP